MPHKKRKLPKLTAEHVREQTQSHGWFQRTLWQCEMVIWGRWTYWIGCLLNGSIQDWEIPQLPFDMVGAPDVSPADNPWPTPFGFDEPITIGMRSMIGTRSAAASHVKRHFDLGYGSGASLTDMIDWWLFAFGSATVTKRPDLPDGAERAMYSLELHRLIGNPSDWAAWIAQDYYSKSAKQRSGWFATPMSVAVAMAQMQFAHESRDTRTLTVMDPCVGTGVMLLVASNYSLRLSGVDIDRTMCRLCEWQGWLYVPWLVYGGGQWIKEFREAESPGASGAGDSEPQGSDADPVPVNVTPAKAEQLTLF